MDVEETLKALKELYWSLSSSVEDSCELDVSNTVGDAIRVIRELAERGAKLANREVYLMTRLAQVTNESSKNAHTISVLRKELAGMEAQVKVLSAKLGEAQQVIDTLRKIEHEDVLQLRECGRKLSAIEELLL